MGRLHVPSVTIRELLDNLAVVAVIEDTQLQQLDQVAVVVVVSVAQVTTRPALIASLAESVTHVPVVPSHRVLVLLAPIKTKLVKQIVSAAAAMDSPQRRLEAHQVVAVFVRRAITCLGASAVLAVSEIHAQPVALHKRLVL